LTAAAYANRKRGARKALRQPRNMPAVQRARDQGQPLGVSFIGDIPWAGPCIHVDGGQRYDWSFVAGLHTVLIVKPGIDCRLALREVLEHTDTIRIGYPVLVDVEAKAVANVVHGNGPGQVQLWQWRRESDLWQQFFGPPSS
jgi:hypothetical protein